MGYLLPRFLGDGVKFIHLTGHLLGRFFDRPDTSIGSNRGAHIGLAESNLVGNQFTLRIAAAFDFDDQSAHQIGDGIFLSAAKESAVVLDARTIGNENLIISAGAIANRERVGATFDNHALEFHLGATGHWTVVWSRCLRSWRRGDLGFGKRCDCQKHNEGREDSEYS